MALVLWFGIACLVLSPVRYDPVIRLNEWVLKKKAERK